MRLKNIHIAIILIGVIFISLSIFHTNMWFDESYSVAIANHSFTEIWTIGGNDVHPIFYYWMLKILNLIFGSNILVYRIFSLIPIAILAILGYTHIRKDFGEKTGIIFSFLIIFLPEMARYAGEIRMYSWAMLFETLAAIYAYRLYKKEFSNKNLAIFGIFSLLGAYTHYYGLMASGIINLMLFVYLIKNFKKQKSYFIKFIITAIIQLTLYVPWLICFATQLNNVSHGFWISLSFPDTLIDVLNVQFCSNLNKYFALAFACLLYIYIGSIIYREKKAKNEIKPGILAISIYLGIIIAALLVSLIMTSAILYNRYLIVVTGILVFFIAFFMAREKIKYITIGILGIILVMSIFNSVIFIQENYDPSNKEVLNFLNENIKENDLIVYPNQAGTGFVTSARFKDNKQYFWDKEHWNVEPAYKAFGPNMEIIYDLDKLNEYKGRIWLFDTSDYMVLNEIDKKYDINVIQKEEFKTKYHGYEYYLCLIEK